MVRVFVSAGPPLVGVMFLFAGFTKAVEPQGFLRHLRRLRLVPPKMLNLTVVVFSALQCFQGAALVLGVGYGWLLPCSLLLLILLAGLTFWSVTTGRVEDCGCYNNFLALSPQESLLLDVLYAALLALGMLGGVESRSAPWMWWAATATGTIGGLVAFLSLSHFRKTGRTLLALQPLKAGRRWKGKWPGSEPAPAIDHEERIIAFLGAGCASCKKWIPVLNMVHQRQGLPNVLGVLPASQETHLAEARFPIVAAKPWRMAQLTRGVTPTAVVLADGVIREVWIGTMSPAFVKRVREEMFATRPPSSSEDARSGPEGSPGIFLPQV